MKIGICSDHAGVEYKARLISYLLGKGYEVVNFGTDSTESMDYADVAHPLATAVENGETILELRVADGDMGKVIGRQGRIAKEIRVLVKSLAQRSQKRVSVDIVD